MERTWDLEDVEVTAQESRTFHIASRDERSSLQVGALVRLHFVLRAPQPGEPRAERMWVEIDSMGSNLFRGYLTNQPEFIRDLRIGDLIEFGPQHVAQLVVSRDHSRWYANAEREALVSENVFEDCCRWLYREPPDREDDSGWRLFSGTETEAQLEDARRIRICNVEWLCEHDPSLRELLRREDCVAFERADRESPWQQVTDWEPLDE
jgi:hypothetical protein